MRLKIGVGSLEAVPLVLIEQKYLLQLYDFVHAHAIFALTTIKEDSIIVFSFFTAIRGCPGDFPELNLENYVRLDEASDSWYHFEPNTLSSSHSASQSTCEAGNGNIAKVSNNREFDTLKYLSSKTDIC